MYIISSAVGLHHMGNVQIASCFQTYALQILTIVTMEALVNLTTMARKLCAPVQTTTKETAVKEGKVSIK